MSDSNEEDRTGLVLPDPPALHLLLMPDEAAFLTRVVAADWQRMTEARDHGVSHGMRGYCPPGLEQATRILHSLDMARTAAAIDAIEAIEAGRQDTADADRTRDTPE